MFCSKALDTKPETSPKLLKLRRGFELGGVDRSLGKDVLFLVQKEGVRCLQESQQHLGP